MEQGEFAVVQDRDADRAEASFVDPGVSAQEAAINPNRVRDHLGLSQDPFKVLAAHSLGIPSVHACSLPVGNLPGVVKIATFNANSIRIRSEIILDWLAEHQPDVLAIQETKCEDDKFPAEIFEDSGYHAVFHGQKSYNGVAILSKAPAKRISTGFGDVSMPEDCRILFAEIDGVAILNTYVPNGNKVGSDKFKYKLEWLNRMRAWMDERMDSGQDCIWLGDINIAREPEDVYDSAKVKGGVGHHPQEFEALDKVLDWGWSDCFRKFTTEGGHFTFWEFVIPRAVERNIGWRIDHIYASPGLLRRCSSCLIDKAPRLLERPSDHTFVVAEFA